MFWWHLDGFDFFLRRPEHQAEGHDPRIRDVTERSLAEEKYKLLFEQMQEGVFATTLEGKLLDCNDALVRMLGYNGRSELMGLNVDTELYSSAEREKLSAAKWKNTTTSAILK